MKEVLKEINEAIKAGMVKDNKLEFSIEVTDNKSYNLANKFFNFAKDSILKKPIIGLYPTSIKIKGENPSKVTICIDVTSDYIKEMGKED